MCVPAGRIPPAVSAGLGDGSASKESSAACSDTKPSREGSAHQNSAQLYLQGLRVSSAATMHARAGSRVSISLVYAHCGESHWKRVIETPGFNFQKNKQKKHLIHKNGVF